MKKIYLGLDLSLNSTGVVALDPEGNILLQDNYKLNTNASNKRVGVSRLRYLSHKLNDTLDKLVDMYPVGETVKIYPTIEGYSMGSKGGMLASIGEWGGVARLLLAERNCQIPAIPSPNQLKKFVTGKGTGGKDVMMLGVYKKWGVEFESNDVNDAYALAQFGRYACETGVKPLVYEQEVIDKVLTGKNK